MELGDLDAKRDWGFAGDYVEASWRMLQAEAADDFVLASEELHSLRHFVEAASAYFGWRLAWRGSGLDEEGYDEISGSTPVRVNAQLFRPAEALGFCGNASRAATILGWRPGSSFEDIVRMMAEADERRGSRDKQAVERSGTGGRHTGETFLKPPATAA